MRVILFVIALMSLGTIAQTTNDDWGDDDNWGDIEEIEIITKKQQSPPRFQHIGMNIFMGQYQAYFLQGYIINAKRPK